MLKHATITRTSRAQQALQLQKQWESHVLQLEQRQQSGDELTLSSLGSCQSATSRPAATTLASNGAPVSAGSPNRTDALVDGPAYQRREAFHEGPADDHDDADVSSLNWLTGALGGAHYGPHHVSQSCSSSPAPSVGVRQAPPAAQNPSKLSSAPSSVLSSPSKPIGPAVAQCDDDGAPEAGKLSTTPSASSMGTVRNCSSESMIRIFAQTLSQELEYVTLHVNAQTKSSQIVRNLLKKFRLKHRDPNLFYLTLERWIRKDGLKFKSVMLLSDEACPLQLQQCCSNPPHNDIKFTLQMRAGALVKIHCSEVSADVRYKCLSLSTQTSVDETINLMLQCLNLAGNQQQQQHHHHHHRQYHNYPQQQQQTGEPLGRSSSARLRSLAGSPGSTTDVSSTSSSSSGIESDPTNGAGLPKQSAPGGRLDSSSRASSVTSISSSSNLSSSSSAGNQLSEQYCLLIECKDTNYRRVLEADEYLVDVYQSLLDEVRESQQASPAGQSSSLASSDASAGQHGNATSPNTSHDLNKQQPDQWFVIKLKRREEVGQQPSVKFTNPRQNMPLPPIPLSLAQHNANALKHIVTTTQIEVNSNTSNSITLSLQRNQSRHERNRRQANQASAGQQQRHPSASHHWPSRSYNCLPTVSADGNGPRGASLVTVGADDSAYGLARLQPQPQQQQQQGIALEPPRRGSHSKQLSVDTSQAGGCASRGAMPPPPRSLIWLPEVRPRRRNLSNGSASTFGRPQSNISNGVNFSRRRYDPAQLAEDLERLDMGSERSAGGELARRAADTTAAPLDATSGLAGAATDCDAELFPAGTSHQDEL